MELLKYLVMTFLLFFITAIAAQEAPVYENSVLTIPSVDSILGPSSLQDVEIQLTEQGEVRLLGFRESIKMGAPSAVELIKVDSFPVQVFLRVSGILISGCLRVGQIRTEVTGNLINTILYFANDDAIFDANAICPAIVTNYSEIVELPVYGLDAGLYEYGIDGKVFGEFTLGVANRIQ